MIDYNISSITLQQIKIFLSVAETLNFSRSAGQLNMSQSGISKSILTMENTLGFPLFRRTSRRVSLTKEGLVLYQKWQTISAQIQSGYAAALAERNKNICKISIGITNTTDSSKYFWKPANEFQTKYPQISLSIESEDMKVLYHNLMDGNYDIVFLPDFEQYDIDTSRFCWKYAAADAVQIIVPIEHPLSKAEELTLSDITEYPITGLHPDTNPNFLRAVRKLYHYVDAEPVIGDLYRSNFQLRYAQMTVNSIHITDNFWNYQPDGFSKKIPLHGYANGIICVWDKHTENKQVQKFAAQFPDKNAARIPDDWILIP